MKTDFTLFPQKKLKPYDGMSITADVWSEAHHYHTQTLNAHQNFLHGVGIVTGLDIVASDPPNNVVYILSGIALDSAGQTIVLSEPVAYDLGQKMIGKLRLMLLHREMKEQAAPDAESNAPTYLRDDYVIVARTDAPNLPYVELARIDRSDTHAPIQDAANFYEPHPNEIDLRFRQLICPPAPLPVLVGICHLDTPMADYMQGVINLGNMVTSQSRYRLIIEDAVPVGPAMLSYNLIFMTATPGSQLNKEQAEIVRAYLEGGGKLLVEFFQPREEKDVIKLLRPAGVMLEQLSAPHPAFAKPNLFFYPPEGSQPNQPGALWGWGESVLCVSGGYHELWNGQAARERLSRSAIRDALEWGTNWVCYLLAQDRYVA